MIETMKILAAGVALAWAAPSAAQETKAPGVFKNGEALYAECASTDPLRIARCDWFLMAAHDMAAFLRDTGKLERDAFCLPRDLPIERVRPQLVERWRDDAGTRRFSAVSSFFHALTDLYPGACK